jgi:hypothetical protein
LALQLLNECINNPYNAICFDVEQQFNDAFDCMRDYDGPPLPTAPLNEV